MANCFADCFKNFVDGFDTVPSLNAVVQQSLLELDRRALHTLDWWPLGCTLVDIIACEMWVFLKYSYQHQKGRVLASTEAVERTVPRLALIVCAIATRERIASWTFSPLGGNRWLEAADDEVVACRSHRLQQLLVGRCSEGVTHVCCVEVADQRAQTTVEIILMQVRSSRWIAPLLQPSITLSYPTENTNIVRCKFVADFRTS